MELWLDSELSRVKLEASLATRQELESKFQNWKKELEYWKKEYHTIQLTSDQKLKKCELQVNLKKNNGIEIITGTGICRIKG